MPDSLQSFKVAGPHIVHDSFEDEVVLLNFKIGIYYSIRKTGIIIWDLIKQGAGLELIVRNILIRYAAKPDHVKETVQKFIADLYAEQLIEPVEANTTAIPEDTPGVLEEKGEKAEFEPPALQKFTDIQEVILLDPIHDVNEMGWPHKKPERGDPEKHEE